MSADFHFLTTLNFRHGLPYPKVKVSVLPSARIQQKDEALQREETKTHGAESHGSATKGRLTAWALLWRPTLSLLFTFKNDAVIRLPRSDEKIVDYSRLGKF